jgi:hypothetical protein
MRQNFVFRFTITYFFTVTLFWLLNYFKMIKLNTDEIFLLGLIISTYYMIFILDRKIKNTDELVKGNFWQLKNELKRKLNGKNKENSGKQVL